MAGASGSTDGSEARKWGGGKLEGSGCSAETTCGQACGIWAAAPGMASGCCRFFGADGSCSFNLRFSPLRGEGDANGSSGLDDFKRLDFASEELFATLLTGNATGGRSVVPPESLARSAAWSLPHGWFGGTSGGGCQALRLCIKASDSSLIFLQLATCFWNSRV